MIDESCDVKTKCSGQFGRIGTDLKNEANVISLLSTNMIHLFLKRWHKLYEEREPRDLRRQF